MFYENDIFIIEVPTPNGVSIENLIFFLNLESRKLAQDFCVMNILRHKKIHIFLLEREYYYEIARAYFFNEVLPPNCIAFSIPYSKIFVMAYHAVCQQYTETEYYKVVLHECIHIFQYLATGIKPSSAIWLYEAIACFLAKQDSATIYIIPTWEQIKDDFYNTPGCYYVAYKLGKYLFKNYIFRDVLTLCTNVQRCEQIISAIFHDLFFIK